MSDGPKNVFVGVLLEARVKFGEPSTWNRPQVSAWVKQRIAELRGERAEVIPFDPKQAQMGERE